MSHTGVNTADHYTIQRIEIAHFGREYNCFVTASCQGIKTSGDATCADNPDTITLRYNYFHDNPTGVWLYDVDIDTQVLA